MKTLLGTLFLLLSYFVGTLFVGLSGFDLPVQSALLEAALATVIGLFVHAAFALAFAFVKPAKDATALP